MSQPYDEKRPDASAGVRDTGSGAMSGPSARSDRAQAIAGPFALRDTVVGGSVLVMLIGSLIPYFNDVITYRNMWTTFPLFFQGIGILLPLIVAGLFAFRRVSPKSHVRIGSLSVDQFASVVAVLAAIFFFLETASSFNASVLIALIGSLGLLAATTFAPFIPGFAADFFGREHIPAHLTARDAIVPEPKPAKPAPAAKPAVGTRESLARPSAAEPAGPGTSVARSQTGAVVNGPSGTGATSQTTKRTSDGADGRPQEAEAGPSAAAAVAASAQAPAASATAGAASATAESASATAGSAESEDPVNADSRDATPSSAQVAATSPARTSGTAEAEVGTAETPGSAVSEATDSDAAAVPEAEGSPSGTDYTGADSSGTDYTVASDVNAEARHSGPSAATSTDGTGHDSSSPSQPATAIHPVIAQESASEPISATRSHEEEPVIEAFWFAVGSGRPVVDESTGKKLFTFEPGDWELCLEDRGNEFLVQNKHTGQTGIMKDLSDIQIPPAEDPSSRRG